MRTETIEYNADGLHMVSHLYYDETKQGRRPGVLVFPEAFTGINVDVTPAAIHAEGLAMLVFGKVTAYFADRSILWVLQANSKAPSNFRLADEYLTIEPYALGLPKKDDDFRLEVDRALSGIYRSGEIVEILTRTFGGGFQPSPMLQSFYLMSAIPD